MIVAPAAGRLRSRRLDVPADGASLFARCDDGGPLAIWLDASDAATARGRWSYIALPHAETVVRTFRTANARPGSPKDVFAWLRRETASAADAQAGPAPFSGGLVGYVGYGAARLLGYRARPSAAEPDAAFAHIDRFLAIDHETDAVHVVVRGADDAECARIAEAIARRCDRPAAREHGATSASPAIALRPTLDPQAYAEAFARIGRHLREGDTYEACLTYRLRGASRVDPERLYGRLRRVNPAAYGAYLRFGRTHVLSSSPERFLRVDGDGGVESRPIKGTAARVPGDSDADARAAAALAADPKTRAENVMIVDLLRNDLARVCEIGSIVVPELCVPETLATLHQLVSSVRGRLRSDATATDALVACFPGGSMTGAPKESTVGILDELEPDPRGVYAGAFGVLGYDGTADLAIAIRSIVVHRGRVAIGTGGAITEASEVAAERREAELKAAAVTRAFTYG